MIGGAIAGTTCFLFILTGSLVLATLSYQLYKRAQLRNQLHEPNCKWQSLHVQYACHCDHGFYISASKIKLTV